MLRDRGYSQEFCSLRQDSVDSSMCCPSLPLHLSFSLHLLFYHIFPSLEPGFVFCWSKWCLLPFVEYRDVPLSGWSKGRRLQTQLALISSLGWWGQAAGAWELEESYGTVGASGKSLSGILFCSMVCRKCSALEGEFPWVVGSGPAALYSKSLCLLFLESPFKCP